MLRYRSLRGRALLIFVLLTALLGVPMGAVARPAPALGDLVADPPTIAASVPLGASAKISVKLTNGSGSAITPAIYEAHPAPSPSIAPNAAHADDPRRVPLPQQAERIDDRLLSDLAQAPDGRGDFVVYMRDQADLSAAYTIADWAERGRFVYRTLVDWAANSQRGLRQQLAARGVPYRPFWIVNAVLVHGALADAQVLAGRDDVALVRANHTAALPPDAPAPAATTDRCSPDQPGNPVCWNVRKIGADRVWRDFGVTGQGIVVANMDTGVAYSHPALTTRYRGYVEPGRYSHDYNWFDPSGLLPAPADFNGHGTHTIGTIVAVGDGTAGQPAVGIAPGARWIAAQGCEFYLCAESDLIASAQWLLAPTTLAGTQPRPELRTMVVNNSWAGQGGNSWYAGYTTAWRAAGIFPVFAAGNASSDTPQVCGSIASPADYPDVVAVGATDADDAIAGFSLLGPTADGRVKPDITAPGTYLSSQQGLLSTYPSAEGYRTLQGTSMATPHVVGLVALLWSANPALIGDYDATYAILRGAAQPRSDSRCGDPAAGPNNVYGGGRIDAYAAVARARVDVPWLSAPAALPPILPGGVASFDVTLDAARIAGPGTYRARLQVYGADLGQPPTTIEIALDVTPAQQQATVTGRVVSAIDGAPLPAMVGVAEASGVQTDASGAYTLTLAYGSYELVASALSFLPARRPIDLAGDLRLPDLVLQPDLPRIVVATEPLSASLAVGERRSITIPIANTGTRPLHYRVQVPAGQFGIWRSDEPGGPAYQWIDLPPDAPALDLHDNEYHDEVPLGIAFPFYGYTYTDTLVTSDGTLAFSMPFLYRGPSSNCLPADEIYFSLIAPFRADLDPSSGGRVRYGTLAGGRTFVLSYEGVPLHSGPPDATYTFQVLLHDDGRIGFQYRTLAALPGSLSVGVQRTFSDLQQVGCGPTTPLRDGLAIELRPQVPQTLWLTGPSEEGELPPGGQQQVVVTLAWVRPNPAWPYRGGVEIASSDPFRPTVSVPVEFAPRAAPHEQWLNIVREQS